MRVVFREFIVKALASSPPEKPAFRGKWETSVSLIVAAAVGAWFLAYKIQCFVGLETTSDLYQNTQLATSWLHGKFLEDNCYGNHLSIHTYLFFPVLGVLAWPFGAVGLLIALGLAAALGVVALEKITRLLGVPRWVALLYAVVAMAMPLSVHLYQDSNYGFHLELLEPVMALWLVYFLLRRKWFGSIAMAVALLAIKEDAPLIVVAAAVIVLGEDLIRSSGAGIFRGSRAWNPQALTVVLLGALALPVLLFVLKSQAVTGYSPGSFPRLRVTDASGISSGGSLTAYVVNHLGDWLRSPNVGRWLGLSVAATFGLIVLRPHFLIVGLVTTLISWLMKDELLWAPRFASSLAFFQIVGCLAFASAYGLARQLWRLDGAGKTGGIVVWLTMVCAMVWGYHSQLRVVTRASEIYRLSPTLVISRPDREKADRLYATYRREAKPGDPAIASDYLFRYVPVQDLFWQDRLENRPTPVWILWDQGARPLSDLWGNLKSGAKKEPADYELVGQAERFLLYKRKSP